MEEIIEIKRKEFTVVETLGRKAKKVQRKGVNYFLKDFGNETRQFLDYVEGFSKLKTTGIKTPKVVMYDKNRNIVVSEFIEGETALETLLEEAFNINFFCKKDKVSIDFDPKNFKLVGDKMYYLAMTCDKYSERWDFEKNHIVIWFYSKEFVKYCKNNLIEFDPKRVESGEGDLNKRIALMVVKYYK